MSNTKPYLICYHAQCPDGFGAALAAWLVLRDTADYVPCAHDGPVPDASGKDVYILDFSFPPEKLDVICAQAKSVTLLDHHLTASEMLKDYSAPNFKMTFDMTRSGARLAWEHFWPETPAPHLITRIEDRDLWKWQFPDSKPYLAALDVLPFEFERWKNFLVLSEKPAHLENILKDGAAFRAKSDQLILDYVADAFEMTLLGHKTLVVNASSVFAGEVGSRLAIKTGTFGVVFRVERDNIRVSLRGAKGFKVSDLALRFGGGGHAAAGAFRIPHGQLGALLDGSLRPAGEVA